MNDDHVNHPALKLATAAAAGIAGFTWNEIAAILAAFYTLLLIGDWLWKRIVRPYLLRTGRIKPKLIARLEDIE